MRTLPIFVLAWSLCVASCSKSPPQPAPSPDKQPKPAPSTQETNVIKDITIRSAVFGSGVKTADVTPRVIHLFHSEPEGFFARKDWLHSDPRPYQNKVLLITYDYQGKSYTISITDQKVNYQLLEGYAKHTK